VKALKLAVIGVGHLGRLHARLLTDMPDVELVGVADPVASARDRVAADCRTTAYADYGPLVGLVDAAIISTPTHSHHAVALDFLRRGVSLLVEKPLTANLREAEELVRTAKRHRAILQVGHIERFNPAFSAAAAHVSEAHYIESVRASGFTGRSTDIGVVHDLMIHDIDLVLSLVGSPLKSVQALGLAILGRKEDVAQARLEFENGCVANLSASRVSFSPTPKRQMLVWSAQGFAAIDFGNRSVNVVHPSQAVVERKIDFESLASEQKDAFKERLFREILRVEPLTVEPRNALADELVEFADCVRTARTPRVSGEHGRDAMAVAEAVLKSMHVHPWHGAKQGPIGPHAVPFPSILPGPHWQPALQSGPALEAG
jgi:predicted dehydrogenase